MYTEQSFSFFGFVIGTVMVAFVLAACEVPEEPVDDPVVEEEPQELTAEEEEEGFYHLFDGTDLDAWRGFQRDDVPAGWRIREDGVLEFEPGQNGGDLLTDESFESFEIRLDFMVSQGGNSGIFYLVAENDYGSTATTGPEYQILDDHAHDLERRFLTASNYELHAPEPDVFRGAEVWNSARIVKDGNHIEHWLNGERVVEYELWSDEWEERLAESKFIDWPDYAKYGEGHIALQDHGDPVWFRNIRVRTW